MISLNPDDILDLLYQMHNNKNITLPVSLTILLILMVASAIFLRLHNLGNPSLWMDEGWSLHFASQPLEGLPSLLASEDKHPPLYYALLHHWLYFGNSETVLRLPAAIFGILTVFITFLFARKFFDIETAVVPSLLVAVSSFHILMSQEVRMYSMAGFFCLLAFYFLWRASLENKIWQWAGYALCAAFAIYTHYITAIVLISANIFAFIAIKEKRWKGFILSNLFVILAFLPWIKFFLLQIHSPFFQHAQLKPVDILDVFYVSAAGFTLRLPEILIHHLPADETFALIIWYLVAIAGAALFIAGAYFCKKEERIYLAGTFLFTLLLAFSASRAGIAQLFETKYMVVVLPLFLILAAKAILNFKPALKWALVAIFLLINLASINNYYTDPKFQRQDWRNVAEYLSTRCNSEDNIIIIPGYAEYTFDYYFKKYGFGANEIPIKKGQLDSLNLRDLQESRKIWLIRSASWIADPNDKIMNELDGNFKFVGEIKTNNINLDFVIIVSEYTVPENIRQEIIY